EAGRGGAGELGGLGARGGAGALGPGLAGWPGRRLQGAGGDPRPGLEALEAGDLAFELVDPFLELLEAILLEADLILELPDAVLLEMDDLKQPLDQRRAVGFRDIGQRDVDDRIRSATARPFALSY